MTWARVLDVTPEKYHTDPCETPSLSSSIAHTLVTQSPAHAWIAHPRFGNYRAETTRALDDGSIIHKLLLGKGSEIDVLEYPDFRTNAAREARDNAIAAGRIPIVVGKYEPLETASNHLRQRLEAFDLRLDEETGTSEVAIEFDDVGLDGPVRCRSMVDFLHRDGSRIVDLKKIRSADARTCSRHAVEYGYHIQWAAYTSAVEKLFPELTGRVDFLFVFLELEPPYAVVPCRPDGVLRELGTMYWQRAVASWEHCLREDRWPAYTESITELSAPPWALADAGL
jgi:hypothetical protein